MRVRSRWRLVGMALTAAILYAVAANSMVVWIYLACALILALVPVGLLGPPLALRVHDLRLLGASSRGFVPPLPQDRGRLFTGRIEIRCASGVDLDRCVLGPILLADGSTWAATATRSDSATLVLAGERERRGRLRLVAVRMRSTWPLGLLTAERWLPLPAELTVHPRYLLPAPGPGRRDQIGAEEALRRGHGEELIGVREYRPGDDRRHVHWRATARTGELMVVETADPAAVPARFCLSLRPEASPAAVERAVTVAASLLAGCVRAGRPFHLEGLAAPGALRRWNESLASLAEVQAPTSNRSDNEAFEHTEIVATGGSVTLRGRSGERVEVGPEIPEHQILRRLEEA